MLSLITLITQRFSYSSISSYPERHLSLIRSGRNLRCANDLCTEVKNICPAELASPHLKLTPSLVPELMSCSGRKCFFCRHFWFFLVSPSMKKDLWAQLSSPWLYFHLPSASPLRETYAWQCLPWKVNPKGKEHSEWGRRASVEYGITEEVATSQQSVTIPSGDQPNRGNPKPSSRASWTSYLEISKGYPSPLVGCGRKLLHAVPGKGLWEKAGDTKK